MLSLPLLDNCHRHKLNLRRGRRDMVAAESPQLVADKHLPAVSKANSQESVGCLDGVLHDVVS